MASSIDKKFACENCGEWRRDRDLRDGLCQDCYDELIGTDDEYLV